MSESTPESKSIIFVLGEITSGGAERVASHLMRYWVEKGWKITLIVGNSKEDDFYEIPNEVDRTVITTGGVSSNKVIGLLKNLPFIWKLRKAIKNADSPNVISFLTRSNIHTILACLGLKKKVIISERNDTTREDHLWPWPALRKMLYQQADIVTANSKIALNGMRDYVSDDKLNIVPNPVVIPQEKATPHQSKKILNVGRLVSQKAQDLLINAISFIEKEKKEGWSLNILGEGEEKKTLEALIYEKKLESYVKLSGLVSDPDKYYASAGIFVLSSKYEGTPNALLEAMSFGLPCIISDSLPGALELIEDEKNGLVFKSGDARDLAEKLLILIEDPEKRFEFGIQAREKVEEFSPDNVLPIWEKVIQL